MSDDMAPTHNIYRRVCTTLCGVLFAVCLLATPNHARAGHYYLEDTEIVPEQAKAELMGLGIQTTEQLLKRVLSTSDRGDLAKRTSLSEEEITVLAHTIELMQIDGIGPRAANLLRASGIKSVADLATRDSSKLLEVVLTTNTAQQITGINPDKMVLDDWIEKAKKAPHHVK